MKFVTKCVNDKYKFTFCMNKLVLSKVIINMVMVQTFEASSANLM